MRFPIVWALPAALLLAGCIVGGTGTDTENGLNGKPGTGPVNVKLTGITARVVDGAGAPIRGVSLELYLPAYRPDTAAARPNLFIASAQPSLSDSSGYVALPLLAAGKFVVEGRLDGETVFYDTLAVPDIKLSSLFTFRTRATRLYKGKVKLASGMRIDSGWVFIRGTARVVKLDVAGAYDLGSLPEDVGRMAVGMRFASSPTSVLQATALRAVQLDSTANPDSLKLQYTCSDVPKDSAAKLVLSATQTPKPDTGAYASHVDTGKVSLALKSCDTLAKGSLVNVVGSGVTTTLSGVARQDSLALLVVNDARPVSAVNGMRVSEAVVIPYAACIPSAGLEHTTFALELLPSGDAILVQDVAESCLAE
jgi:hypothetical protein